MSFFVDDRQRVCAQLRTWLIPAVLIFAALATATGAIASSGGRARPARLAVRAHVRRVASQASVGSPALAPRDAVSGLVPADLHAAYSLPTTGAPHQKIAVITAYDDPAAASDLSTYLSTYRLAPCTVKSHCFQKVNEQGNSGPLPGPDPTGGDYITEAALGTEVARGVCQSCAILLVEASLASNHDFSVAVATAERLGAQAISVSLNAPEGPSDTTDYTPAYVNPRSVVVSATGDNGNSGGITFPASIPDVLAVGGTQLKFNSQGGYGGETAWNSSGNGCSLYTSAPGWQTALAKSVGCGSMRAVADIAAVADPGALVRITGVYGTAGGGWYEVGGTSLSAPIIAGAVGLAGGLGSAEASLLYQHARANPSQLHDIKSGTTLGCTGQPICTARPGYDGPTGLGTPNGLALFSATGGVIDPRRPQVSATAPNGRIRVSSRWASHLALRNQNAFTVTGSVALRSTRRLSVGGHRQTVTFATLHLRLGSFGSVQPSFVIAPRYRGLLARLRVVGVSAQIRVRGLSGRTVTVTQHFSLRAP